VQRILKLSKHSACTEEGESNPDDRGERTLPRGRSCPRNVLHHLDRTFIEEITHLLGEFRPCTSGIVPEDHADNSEQNENECREHMKAINVLNRISQSAI